MIAAAVAGVAFVADPAEGQHGFVLHRLRPEGQARDRGPGSVAFAGSPVQLHYIDGDYGNDATFQALRKELGNAQHPAHYLAIPPLLFEQVVEQLMKSGCAKGARVKFSGGRPTVIDGPFTEAKELIAGFAMIDVKSKEALLHAVEDTRREGRAILVASGELEDLRVCDRVLVMRHGKVVAEHAAGWSDNELVASVEGI